MKTLIKSFIATICLVMLAGCSTSSSSYYSEPPSEFLIDNQGKYIDENGNRVEKPVKNPYFDDYTKNSSSLILVKPKRPKEGVHYRAQPY